MRSNRSPKAPYSRDLDGLCDALFDELEDLRNGVSAAHEAVAFSKLAAQVLGCVETKMRQTAFEHRLAREAALPNRATPMLEDLTDVEYAEAAE